MAGVPDLTDQDEWDGRVLDIAGKEVEEYPSMWVMTDEFARLKIRGGSEDFGRAVVQLRAYAATNPNAWGYERPITLEEHQASRLIVERGRIAKVTSAKRVEASTSTTSAS